MHKSKFLLFLSDVNKTSLMESLDCSAKPVQQRSGLSSRQSPASKTQSGLSSENPSVRKGGCVWWLCGHASNCQTHPHGWRDAAGARLAVTGPESAVVPGDGRVELQLMPLFLWGRRTRKDFDWPGCSCICALWATRLICLMPHRWPTQHRVRGHFIKTVSLPLQMTTHN